LEKNFIPGKHSFADFSAVMKELEQDQSIQSVLIFSGGGTSIHKEEYDLLLKSSRLSIMGGIFPEIIFEGKRYQDGTVIIGCSQQMHTISITDWDSDIEEQVSQSVHKINPENKSVWMFVDALVSEKSKLFDSLYNIYGTIPKYIGAGAGTLDFNKFPCVFSNEGMIEMGAVIGICGISTSVGVAHGWEPITKPLKVTESVNNKIISLDWQPAMEVYKNVVESHSKKDFDFEDFINCAKSYPFGISKLNADMVIRDPFKQEDNCIYTLDSIDQGSHVSIMFGNTESLIQGACEAKKKAFEGHDESEAEIMIIDCISRVLFLDSLFERELDGMDSENRSFGALTLGEIANNGDSYLEVFNKTAVVCAIYE